MKLTYDIIMKLMDALDEHFTLLKNKDAQTLVDCKMASNLQVAQRFLDIYPTDPDRALVSLICDHYHPDRLYSRSGKSSWIILTGFPQSNPTETYILNYINRKRQGIINHLNQHKYSHRRRTASAAAL